ncbi:ATP-dependent 6-phosphofructokinase 5, chloroplastic, partial [Mucuna pruriens]
MWAPKAEIVRLENEQKRKVGVCLDYDDDSTELGYGIGRVYWIESNSSLVEKNIVFSKNCEQISLPRPPLPFRNIPLVPQSLLPLPREATKATHDSLAAALTLAMCDTISWLHENSDLQASILPTKLLRVGIGRKEVDKQNGGLAAKNGGLEGGTVHRAGPREKIYYKPEEVKAAIVTCGGLCPGLNDVIRQIVITLEIYGVKNIVGIPFGYRGFSDKELTELPLSRKVVQNIHLSGGSLLGVSRGGPGVSDIVDSLEERGINMLFVLGGNGTHAGANAIHYESKALLVPTTEGRRLGCCRRRRPSPLSTTVCHRHSVRRPLSYLFQCSEPWLEVL